MGSPLTLDTKLRTWRKTMKLYAIQSRGSLGNAASEIEMHTMNSCNQQSDAIGDSLVKKLARVATSLVLSVAVLCLVNVSKVYADDEVQFLLGAFGQPTSFNGPRPMYSQGSDNPESEEERPMRVVEEGQTIRFLVVAEEPIEEELTFNIVWTQTGKFLDPDNMVQKVTMEAGESVQRFSIDTIDDDLDEENGIATATLHEGDNYEVGDPSSASVIVADNDETPMLSLSPVTTTIYEGEAAKYKISTNQLKSADPLTVKINIELGSVSQDFLVGSRTRFVTLPAEATEVTFDVLTQNDSEDDPDGKLIVSIESGDGYTVAATPDDEASVAVNSLAPTVFIRDAKSATRTITEGEQVRFLLVTDGRSRNQLDVNVVWSQNGDFIDGSDFNKVVSITPGRVSQRFTIDTVDDEVDEENGTITATLAAGSNYTVSDKLTSATINVLDNDGIETAPIPPVVSVRAVDSETPEGRHARFEIVTDQRLISDLSIDLEIIESRGSKSPITNSRSVTIHERGYNGLLYANLRSDGVFTNGGTISVEIVADEDSLYTIDDAPGNSATVNIIEEDALPYIGIRSESATVTEGSPANFFLEALQPIYTDISVDLRVYKYEDNGVFNYFGNSDGELHTIELVKTTDETSVPYTTPFPVATGENELNESNYKIKVTLMNPEAGDLYQLEVSPDNSEIVEVIDNDPTPVVSISSVKSTITEGENAEFSLSMTSKSMDDVTVDVDVSQSGDFLAATPNPLTSLVVDAEAVSGTYIFATVDDTRDELDGSVTIKLKAGAGYILHETDIQETISVQDNDIIPVVSIASVKSPITEGEDAEYTLNLSGAASINLNIAVQITQSADFLVNQPANNVSHLVEAGVVSKTFGVATEDDDVDEAEGSVNVRVMPGEGYLVEGYDHEIIGDFTGDRVVIIVQDNDETPVPTLSISSLNASVVEGSTFTFSVQSDIIPSSEFDISFGTEFSGDFFGEDTAIFRSSGNLILSDFDFSEFNGHFNISFDTVDDDVDESDGSVTYTIQSSSDYNVASAPNNSATITIQDNDEPTPVVSISSANSAVTEGSPAVFRITVDPSPTAAFDLTISTAFSGDFFGTDSASIRTAGTLTLSGVTQSQDYSVQTVNDDLDESNGLVTFTLQDGSDYDVQSSPNNSAVVTIQDNDEPTPVVSIASASTSVTEGSPAVFRITVDPSPTAAFDLTISTAFSGDFFGTDSASIRTAGTLTLSNVTQSQDYSVQTVNDDLDESDGSVTFTIQDGSDYDVQSSPNNSAIVTIQDNDLPVVPELSIVAKSSRVFATEDVVFNVNFSASTTIPLVIGFNLSSDVEDSTDTAITRTVATSDLSTSADGQKYYELVIPHSTSRVDGTMTAEIQTGTGYTVDSDANSASVLISDPILSLTSLVTLVREGNNAQFKVSSDVALKSDTAIGFEVSQTGNFLASTTIESQTMETGDSELQVEVAITNDEIKESDGSVTLQLVAGNNYVLHETNSSATVNVADDDTPTISFDTDKAVYVQGEPITFRYFVTPRPVRNITFYVRFKELDHDLDFPFNYNASITPEWFEKYHKTLPDGREYRYTTLDGYYSNRSLGRIEVSITDYWDVGQRYRLANNKFIFTIVRASTPQQSFSEAVNTDILPNVLEPITQQTAEALSERVQQAFKSDEQFLFEFAGNSEITNMLQAGGELFNDDSLTLTEFLSDSSFMLSTESGGNSSITTTIWGTGYKNDALRSSNISENSWDGETFVGHLGLDAKIGEHTLLGVTSTYDESEIDLEIETDNLSLDGDVLINSRSLNPYLAYNSEEFGAQFRVSAGYGTGEIEIRPKGYNAEKTDTNISTFLFGGSKELYSTDKLFGENTLDITAKGDAWTAQQFIHENGLNINSAEVEVSNARLGTEGTFNYTFDSGSTLNPKLTLGGLWEGGDLENKVGFELGNEIVYTNPFGYSIKGLSQTLLGKDFFVEEWGVRGTVQYDQGNDKIGAIYRISPTWGDPDAVDSENLWNNLTASNKKTALNESNDARVETEFGFGIKAFDDYGLFTPYSGFDFTNDGEFDYQLGSRITIGDDFEFAIEGARETQTDGDLDHKVSLEGNLTW